MALIYVRSTDGNDADSGATWALAKATLVGALAIAVGGDRIWVSQVHAETQAASMTLAAPAGAESNPIEILCGNDGAAPPTALATTATVTTTTSFMIIKGSVVVYGIAFSATSGGITVCSSASLDDNQIYLSCGFAVGSTSFTVGASNVDQSRRVMFKDCTVVLTGTPFSAISLWGTKSTWIGGSIALTGSVPTNLIGENLALPVVFRGVDLSAFGSGKTLFPGGLGLNSISFEHCKLGASVALFSGTIRVDMALSLDNSDSGDTQYRMQRALFEGSIFSETVIVRTGGASDGVTPLSHKMVSGTVGRFYLPLYGPDLIIHNAAVGANKTVTIEILHDSVTALKDTDVWLEVEYLGTSGFPIASFATDRAADILATGADQTSSSVAWTTTGLSNPNKQKLAVTFTPQELGVFRCRVALAKPSYTIYVDPLLTVA